MALTDPSGQMSIDARIAIRGLAWKFPCIAATTANITIATGLNSGDTIDGVTLADGDHVLVKNQSSGAQNGIYIVGATPVRSWDMDQDATSDVPIDEVRGAAVYVIAGSTNAGKVFFCTNTAAATLGTTALTWTELTAAGAITVEDEGTPLTTAATTLDFVGAGVTASGAGAEKTITIPGGISGITVEDEGTPLATAATTLDFTGAGVTASGTGTEKTINIPGGGVPDLSTLTIEPMIQGYSDYVAAYDVSASQTCGFRVGQLVSGPQYYSFEDECFLHVSDTSSWAGGLDDNFSGASAAISETSEAGHPGVLIINAGTATTGRSRLGSVTQTGLTLGGGAYNLLCIAKIPTLSDGTNTFTVRLGLGAAALGDSAEAVYFRYGSALNGGEWQGVCRTGGSEAGSVLDTNVAADTNWHTFEFIVNAAATSVEFFIDGASVGTVSTNIPTGAFAGPNFMIVKSAGGSSRTLHLDYYRVIHQLTTAR